MAQLETNLQKNTTGIRAKMNGLVAKIKDAQQALVRQSDADLQDVRRGTSSSLAELRQNFTTELAADFEQQKRILQAKFDALSTQVEQGAEGPSKAVAQDQASLDELSKAARGRLDTSDGALADLASRTAVWGRDMTKVLQTSVLLIKPVCC